MICKKISGGVMSPPTIRSIKYAYFLILRKNCGVNMPRLVKNMVTIGISKINANGMVILNTNLKYFSTVNNSLNMSSYKESKKGRIKIRNKTKPNINPNKNKRKTAGI